MREVSCSGVAAMVVILSMIASVVTTQDTVSRIVLNSDWELSEQFVASPSRWAYIKNDTSGLARWPICLDGKRQSPADLKQAGTVQELKPVTNSWVVSNNFSVSNDGVRIRIQPQDVEPSFLDPNTGTSSPLRYIQFHIPSGHRSGGSSADLELSIVHGGSVDDGRTQPTVIITTQFVAGFVDSSILATIIPNIPSPPSRDADGIVSAPRVQIARQELNIARLLPPVARDYAFYIGSELSPPCREGVRHYVFASRLRMSFAQLAAIRAQLHVNDALNAGWAPRVARASRSAVVPTDQRATIPELRYVVPRHDGRYAVSPAPEFEDVSANTIVALTGLCFSALMCLLAIIGFLLALCYPRTERQSTTA